MSQILLNPHRFVSSFSLSDSQWTCNVDQFHNGSSNNLIIEFLSDGATPSYSGAYYGLGMFMQDNGSQYYNITTNNNNGSRSEAFYPSSSERLNAYKNTVIYTQLTRLSSTSFRTEVFSDSNRTTSLGSSTQTISSNIAGLNQICIWSNGNGGNYYFDNVKIWNNTTSDSGSPDYENDFSSSTGWTQSGTSVNINSAHTGAAGSTSTTQGDYVIRNF